MGNLVLHWCMHFCVVLSSREGVDYFYEQLIYFSSRFLSSLDRIALVVGGWQVAPDRLQQYSLPF